MCYEPFDVSPLPDVDHAIIVTLMGCAVSDRSFRKHTTATQVGQVVAPADHLYENSDMHPQAAGKPRQSRGPTPLIFPVRTGSVFMSVTEILREIDAEIRKLERVREILQESSGVPARPKRKSRTRKAIPHKADPLENVISLPVDAAVKVTVIPPRRERERRSRIQIPSPIARAIDVVIPEKPVFVPRPCIANPSAGPANAVEEADVSKLEATFRKSLFGASDAETSR